jgi:tetratricopeptide (TPR) repeat protein
MPRVVPRAAYWYGLSGIVLGAIALVAFGWTWSSRRRDPNVVEQGVSAYAKHDFRRAVELARRRLKEAPEDVDALRLLARATARLGRDVPANALFARLGSTALEAEDFYLLGLGLDHTGRKDEAGRLWEKGLALQPDHAETIVQLIIRYTAQNRLAEAAQLAQRLARQPGWELRGELDLGALRGELSDPAGAAAALRRALERPEASELDRATIDTYRKLLARSLLRVERAEEARPILQKVLANSQDREASWLLSRAELQKGAIPEAVAALQAAGSYRAEHPLETEPGPYVGESQCASCHKDEVRAAQASRHNTTVVRGNPLAEFPYPDRPILDPDDPLVTHTFRRQAGKVHFESRVKDQVLHAVVDYAFGSPDHYFSLVGHDDQGVPYILRLSHYQTARDSGWVRTTGHSADATAGQHFLGKPIDVVDGVHRCLFCHSTDPKAVLDRSGPAANDRAIGCERCHGPGGNHLRAMEAKLTDRAIASPAEAPAEGRLRVCGQCHSHHQESSLPRTDPYWIRFEGTTIAWSRCFTESAGSFDCMTCHDPHHDNDRSSGHYNARCLTCHSAGAAAETKARPRTSDLPAERTARGSICPLNPSDGCIACHMPPFESKPLHATFADHYIRVHPELKTGVTK